MYPRKELAGRPRSWWLFWAAVMTTFQFAGHLAFKSKKYSEVHVSAVSLAITFSLFCLLLWYLSRPWFVQARGWRMVAMSLLPGVIASAAICFPSEMARFLLR
jgi:hypothetical protein